VKAICVWCRAEGRPGLVGEHPPLEDAGETRGICWVHKLQMLRGTRMPGASRSRTAEESGQFVVIVARHDAALFARVSEQLLDDPRVSVILDRRYGERRQESRRYWRERRQVERRQPPDYWDDTRYHPVIVVAMRKSGDAEGALALTADESIPEGVTSMESDPLTDARRRIDDWARDGQDILNKVLPQLLAEGESYRQRAELAEGQSARLAREVEDLQRERGKLQTEVERLRHEEADMADALERTFADMSRLAGDMLAKVKGHHPPRVSRG
jgi:hypothetical protein